MKELLELSALELGAAIRAGDVFNAQRVLCCVLILVILIILLDGVVRLLEARLLRWR